MKCRYSAALFFALLLSILSGASIAQQVISSSSSSSSSSSGGTPVAYETAPPPLAGYTLCAKRGERCYLPTPAAPRTALMGGCRTVGLAGPSGNLIDGGTSCSYGPPQVFSGAFLCDPSSFSQAQPFSFACYVSTSTVTATNLALSATASASSQSGKTRAPARANDGDAMTRWTASNSSKNSWLRLTLAQPASIQKVVLNEYDGKVKAFRVEYLSGSAWITAASGTSIGSPKVISFTPVNTGSVRVLFTDLSGQPSINEFEVY